jgi:hypothetical protein
MKHEVIITIDGKEILNIPRDTEVCEYTSTARIWDWREMHGIMDATHALYYLELYERFATDKLKAKGYLFLNDVYDMLGLTLTAEGAVLGWVYEKDKVVDFGVYDFDNTEAVYGYDSKFVLRFNVDGCILEHLS